MRFGMRSWKRDRLTSVKGIVRGYRNQLLSGQNYGNLTQCETIDGKMQPYLP